MTSKTLLLAIHHLEKSSFVNSLKIDNVHVWPLVRFNLNFGRKYNIDSKSIKSPLLLAISALVAFCKNKTTYSDNVKVKSKLEKINQQINDSTVKISHLEKTDVLVLCLEKDHYQTIKGKPFSPLLDSLSFIHTDIQYNLLKLSLGWKNIKQPYFPTKNLNISPFVAKENIDTLLNPYSIKRLSETLQICLWLGKLSFSLKRYGCKYKIDPKAILELIPKLRGQRNFYKKLLVQIEPKVIIMTSYSGRIGLVCAAKELGIPVIDIQHGGINKDHPYYGNWANIPKGGYWYVPDYYWCWSQTSAEIIKNCKGDFKSLPKTLIGGNPWLGLCLSEKSKELLDEKQIEFIETLSSKPKKVILLALQYGPNSPIDDFVIDLIKETSKEWKWLIRLHPLGRELKTDLMERLTGYIYEKEIDIVTDIPLHILLKEVDNLVTGFSTICAEAFSLGIKTTFTDHYGYNLYKSDIQKGKYDFANNKDLLKNSLQSKSLIIEDKESQVIPTSANDIDNILKLFL